MIDNIALRETLPVNSGLEDSVIRLPAIHAALTDTDGSEFLTVVIHALPVGAVLSDGVRSFTATAGGTSADISAWNRTNLTLIPPLNFNGTINLSVVATAIEGAAGTLATSGNSGNSATTAASITLGVLAVNDAPQAANASYAMARNGNVRIDFASLLRDVDGDTLSLSFAQPAHGKLTRNHDGSYTYRPKKGYSGTDSLTYLVSDGQFTTSALLTFAVAGGSGGEHDDDGDCDDDQDGDHDGGSAGSYQTAGSNLGSTLGSTPISINWNSAATVENAWSNLSPPPQQAWIADFFGATGAQRSLAEITGLVVPMPPV